jgi:hypothetical protein
MIDLLLISLAAAILSVESTISSLIFRFKQVLFLNEENKYINLLSNLSTYPQIIGFAASYILFPLVLLVCLLANLHIILRELLSCSYCTAFHLGWILMLLVSPELITLKQFILHSTLPLLFVSIYLRLR